MMVENYDIFIKEIYETEIDKKIFKTFKWTEKTQI